MIVESTQLRTIAITVHTGRALEDALPRLSEYVARRTPISLSRHPAWLRVLKRGFGHEVLCLEASEGEGTCGILPLASVSSLLFGKYLVSLPYLNQGGVITDDRAVANRLISEAVNLAQRLKVRHLGLRHEAPVVHPDLTEALTGKVNVRLPLPGTAGRLWDQLDCKVRNQVRKGQKQGLTVHWGGTALLPQFYGVFSRNMRDLGTPVFGQKLFLSILEEFPDQAELCVVRAGAKPIAGALLLHGRGITEVPSASALREFNPTCANMLMYWQLIDRSIQRGQAVFDFGRSSMDSPTFRFKRQWGGDACPTHWQFHVLRGEVSDVRPDNPKYNRLIRWWQRLPVWLTRMIGPRIARGIP